ncbi:Mpo1-like protein [Dendronalium sp. ChiSLP03b]|uniref:Mpo1-like protein n=1 Tax=Dendronalium sp. ChiSLP03b TaxID=3075381 RepID=UPI002AD351EA|nr:Mpo1-like protein [Dendronalium sp. ChiSLP03b]MDZ8204723.1 Mpo1-like protein [Dendronalium sp. ChiSLP03b]
MNQLNYNLQQNLRNKINNQILDHPFTDYWDIFVLKHQHPINITLHILGIFFFYGLLFYVWKLQTFYLLLGLPLTQVLGLIGHLLFERSHIDLQDAIFSWRASDCLGRMLVKVLIGKYQDDIRLRKEILQKYQSTNYANI